VNDFSALGKSTSIETFISAPLGQLAGFRQTCRAGSCRCAIAENRLAVDVPVSVQNIQLP